MTKQGKGETGELIFYIKKKGGALLLFFYNVVELGYLYNGVGIKRVFRKERCYIYEAVYIILAFPGKKHHAAVKLVAVCLAGALR